MNGSGVCQWTDGTQYEGNWKDCVKEGHGT